MGREVHEVQPTPLQGVQCTRGRRVLGQEVEQLFSLLECPDRERVVLATHVLQGAAGDWWRLVRRTTLQGRDIKEITWDEFRTLFLEKFFPRYSRDRRYQEFLALT